jgi:hypothetical protein
MLKTSIELDTPESHEECADLSCETCAIMYKTLYSSELPPCFYHEKSMYYLQMQVSEASAL